MGVDRLDFPLAQPESRLLLPVEFCSDSILPVGWGKKKRSKMT